VQLDVDVEVWHQLFVALRKLWRFFLVSLKFPDALSNYFSLA
jgi:hypothetical protein